VRAGQVIKIRVGKGGQAGGSSCYPTVPPRDGADGRIIVRW
jgi:hypothetical protein